MDGDKRDCNEAHPLAGDAEIEVLVSSGMHEGARLDTLTLPLTIGSDLACDIVLGDDGVKPCHLRLYSERGAWFLAALQGAVHINGCERLAPGHGKRIPLPLDIAIGNARLQLSNPGALSIAPTPWMGWSKHARRHQRGLAIASMIVAIMIGGPAVFAGFSPSSDLPIAPIGLSEHTQESSGDDSVEEFLRHALAKQELIHLSLRKEQAAWIVSGDVDRTGYGRWLDVRQAAEARYGSGLVIESKVNANGLNPPAINIAAVRLGATPYVIDDHGRRYTPGMAISDGWVLSRIDTQALVLRHGSIEHKRGY